MTPFKAVFALLLVAMISGCVTTTTSPFAEKKDLDKAVDTYVQIGYRHFENDNLFQAKQALNRAMELDDNHSGAHLGLARVFDVEEEDELAEHHFRRAIRYDGGTEARFQYAVFLYNHKRYDDAYDEFGEVAEDTFYARRALSFEFLALSARRIDRIDEAITAYERAIVLDRLLVNSYIGLADLREQRGESEKAFKAYQGFVSLVRADRATQSAFTLWLGIRIAHQVQASNLLSSLELQLRNRFPDSEEYQQYRSWKQNKEAA